MSSIALTFDDGPDPVWTPRLLDVLGALDVRATFFPISSRAAALPSCSRGCGTTATRSACTATSTSATPNATSIGCATTRATALGALAAADVRPTLWRTPWGDTAPWTTTVAARARAAAGRLDRSIRTIGAATAPRRCSSHTPDELDDGSIVLAHDGIGPGARRDGADETARLRRARRRARRAARAALEALT